MNIVEKLGRIQLELRAPKDQNNSFGKFNYRTAEGIMAAVKPITVKYGVTILCTDRIEIVNGQPALVSTVSAKDWEKSEEVCAEGWAMLDLGKKGMDACQVTGAASSYARKYALCGLLSIDDSRQDPDYTMGRASSTEAAQTQNDPRGRQKSAAQSGYGQQNAAVQRQDAVSGWKPLETPYWDGIVMSDH